MEDINQDSGDMATEDQSLAGNQDAQPENGTDAPAQTPNEPSGKPHPALPLHIILSFILFVC